MNLSKREIVLFTAMTAVNFVAMVSSIAEGRWWYVLNNINVMIWCWLYYQKVHECNNLRDSIKRINTVRGIWR